MIRTLIADDEPLAREGIRARLVDEADFDVGGEAGDGFEVVGAVAALHPDLLFLDVQMPGFQVKDRDHFILLKPEESTRSTRSATTPSSTRAAEPSWSA